MKLSSNRKGPTRPRIAVLGAGPAGLTAALCLARTRHYDVIVLERGDSVGGNTGSFLLDGVWCDHGSHRLHRAAGDRVLGELRSLLGADLLLRPRHGRILLQQRWIHFPLKPVDLALRLPKPFTARLGLDAIRKLVPRRMPADRSFASVLGHSLGPAMCEAFYYPYVRKLWGVPPEQLAATLAERRVSGSSLWKIAAKVVRQAMGSGTGGFYYPRQGFGSISERLKEGAEAEGASVILGAQVNGIAVRERRVSAVRYKLDGKEAEESVDAVWSTLPLSAMVRMIDPGPNAKVLEAAANIRYRGMILIYLVLEQDQFTEYDAHYFPERSVPISRLSEPKNYSAASEPQGRTVLCAELPSDPGDEVWDLTDKALGARLCDWLGAVGLPVESKVARVVTRRLRFAYPVYDRNYEVHFRTIDDWLSGLDGLLTFGRQGLFAHDNTHHAMTMAYAAAECLGEDGRFDGERWLRYREEFTSHVVED